MVVEATKWESFPKKLIRVANAYPDGIQAGDRKDIPIVYVCSRWENGAQTAGGSRPFKDQTQPRFCTDGLSEFKQPGRVLSMGCTYSNGGRPWPLLF